MTDQLDDKVEQFNNKVKQLKDKANNFELKPPRSEQKALMEDIECLSNRDWSAIDRSAEVDIVQKKTDAIRTKLENMPAVSPAERGSILELLPEIEECADRLLFERTPITLE